ncbi:MAG TPA: S41 family peptidase [Flavobacteriaceae bacterium]|nr:S41 family peptidase [Flavobacteriaceae bacterium]MCB9212181.1 S41 family peptidase [Alteromonas sp.]HPF10441.1 S41 family peptidase [Flavobacteriaceae bacterium]HQU21750.1 S41 family peptidase [Flavobacteriaceae bacterium]HQU64652.1 S41 family peptidase [Flavobacteriaceae bacterium]
MGKTKKILPLLLGIALALGVFVGSKLNFKDSNEKIFATNSKKDKLNRLIDYIDYEYVDAVNTDSIVDVTVNGILENLDPHSVYIPVAAYEENADDMRGNFVGIGVSFYVYKDSIAVIRAIEGGSAEKAGIKGGDRILYADGKKLFGDGVDRDSISKFLKGEINSKVNLKVYRKGEKELLDIKLKRKRIPIISVDASYMLEGSLGYIKINRFSESTYSEFKKSLDVLLDQGMKSLVLDLRDNPGGYISSAEKILDEFLGDDTLLLITKNKAGEETYSYASGKGEFEDGKLFVLINENTASASEIVAGALQDNDKGTIIGRRSFGKGLVQREMALGDGSAVRLTIARYYTPTGRSIQRPYGDGNGEYYSDYEQRYRNGELLHADSIKVADSLKYVTPKGKVVYGGGGIIPDVFVPKDTSIANETLDYVARNGFMSYFIFEYLEVHRNQFNALDFEKFKKEFEVTDDLAKEFIDYARLQEAQIDMTGYEEALKLALKANIAQQLYGPNAYEFILNATDPMLQKVMQLQSKNSAD